ncbi:hypothetical protein OU994_00150 [Pseudoduganella sp. SL102]|uniref:T6SS effector BTH_I2691 family protein n=1 Tax=Pseudoduganella sp. SL102 TaxID=2995154 RepID=UPI00248C4AC4|nr:T6SS effector BTH_I2691 family protein [Pseudoduganella sp. SL102]WBS02752.1 hypothetical protein OU994_00150 [Pseudoduganella sp. SL102]
MKKDCNMCGREGVLIYPLRYAVACPNGASNVPDLPANFRVDNAPSSIAPAKYTLRSLRSGYLYTYDEKRRQLKAYIVFENGGLWEFPVNHPPNFDANHTPQPCTDPVDISLSRCVDIIHTEADPAGYFWVGWSNSRWTKRLISKVNEKNWRLLHMQCIDVPAMLSGPVPHASSFLSTLDSIPQFCLSSEQMRLAFKFSTYDIGKELLIKKWARRTSLVFERYSSTHSGYVIALNDPIGVLADLSELIIPTVHSGFNENSYRAKVVSNMILATEAAYKSDFLSRDAEEKRMEIEGSPNPIINSKYKYKNFLGRMSPKKPEVSRKVQATADAEKSWKDLICPDGRPILNEVTLREWQPKYNLALEKFKPTGDRLASIHAEWLRCVQLCNWMNGVHDDANINSGVNYRENLAQCIGYGIASEHCAGVLTKWLGSADPSDMKNLYARALLFNNKALIDYTVPRLKDSDIPWEGIFNVYKKAVELAGQSSPLNAFDRLLLATANIISENATNLQNRPMHNLVVVGLSLTAEVPVRTSALTVGGIQSWIVSETMGRVPNENLFCLNSEARRVAEDILAQRRNNSANFALQLDMAKLQQEGRITSNVVNVIDIPSIGSIEGWFSSSTTPVEFRLGVVAIILQMIALSFSLRDLHKSDDASRFETRLKSALAAVSLASSLVEVAMATVKASSLHPLSMYINTHWGFAARNSRHLGVAARVVGGAIGVIAGCIDVYKGFMAFKSGDKVLGTVQATAGAAGIALGILTIAGFVAIGWVLVFAVVVGFIIPALSPSSLQQWLGRCYFGVENPKYRSLDDEISAFKEAVGG